MPAEGKLIVHGHGSTSVEGKTSPVVLVGNPNVGKYERLTLLGVEPGAEIKLYQKIPSFVVKVDQTEVALDKEVAKEIFVRPSNGK